MPEEGWEIVTVKTDTKKALMRISRARRMSMNDLIISQLWKGGVIPRRTRTPKRR